MNEKEKVLTHLDIPYSYELAKRMEMPTGVIRSWDIGRQDQKQSF